MLTGFLAVLALLTAAGVYLTERVDRPRRAAICAAGQGAPR